MSFVHGPAFHLSSPEPPKLFWTIWHSGHTVKPLHVGDSVPKQNPDTAETTSVQIEQDIAQIELEFPVGGAISAEDPGDSNHPPFVLPPALSPVHLTIGRSYFTMTLKQTRSLHYRQSVATI